MEKKNKGLGSSQEDLDKIKKDLERSNIIMIGVIVVLFAGYVGLSFALGAILIDDFRSKEASYTDLVKEVEQMNSRLDTLSKQGNTTI
jgi:hypothetical protein